MMNNPNCVNQGTSSKYGLAVLFLLGGAFIFGLVMGRRDARLVEEKHRLSADDEADAILAERLYTAHQGMSSTRVLH